MRKRGRGPKSEWEGAKVALLEEMLTNGATLQECAEHFGVSKARIGQIRSKFLKHITREQLGASLKVLQEREKRREEIRLHFNRNTYNPSTELEAAFSKAFTRKRQNSKVKGAPWEFTVRMSDIDWPTHCPVLGLELDWFAEVRCEASPSFDRIDPSKGYIPGNVAIISWRANRIKNDGTAEEHKKIANWLLASILDLEAEISALT
jgi:hypothetical protein